MNFVLIGFIVVFGIVFLALINSGGNIRIQQFTKYNEYKSRQRKSTSAIESMGIIFLAEVDSCQLLRGMMNLIHPENLMEMINPKSKWFNRRIEIAYQENFKRLWGNATKEERKKFCRYLMGEV